MTTLTVELTEEEASVVGRLATTTEMTPTQVIRQALRLYQLHVGQDILRSGTRELLCGCKQSLHYETVAPCGIHDLNQVSHGNL